jgi:hypothetical protein
MDEHGLIFCDFGYIHGPVDANVPEILPSTLIKSQRTGDSLGSMRVDNKESVKIRVHP